MITKPVNLTAALESFDESYSPRIVAHVNDYDVRIAHTNTDEFFLVLDGEFHVACEMVKGRNRPGAPSTSRLRPVVRS